MAIQQSINQLLSSTYWAGALYAHQPDVAEARKEKRELKNLQAEMDEAEAYAKEHPLQDEPTAEQKEKFMNEWGLTGEAIDKAPDELTDNLPEIVNWLEGQTPIEESHIHSKKVWNQMKARRRQLDPEYREQKYQQELGMRKTKAALQKLLKGKIGIEEFKAKVGMTDGE